MLRRLLALLLVLVLQTAAASASAPPPHPRLWTDQIPPLEVLGLAPPFYQFWPYETPSEAAVKAGYRKKSLAFHPDKNRDNPNAANSFYRVSQAHDYLKGNDAIGKATRDLEARRYAHYGTVLRDAANVCDSIGLR
jgi:preprotein translocase subunit Sec63